ncbi:MAG: SPOR domain-containing protein, partial [Alphaproteobacteria bacterium]|nr:SPOR domain-containing protein [Alphaproteobacteria bacterium]
AEKIINSNKGTKVTASEKAAKPEKTVTVQEKVVSVQIVVPAEEKIETVKAADDTKKAAETKVAKESENSSSAQIPAGYWQIQLISSPNKSAMEKAWVNMTPKYPELKNLPHEIESADLGSKGTFYRLKAGSFSNRTDADKLCNTIKTAGGSCLVKKK